MHVAAKVEEEDEQAPSVWSGLGEPGPRYHGPGWMEFVSQ